MPIRAKSSQEVKGLRWEIHKIGVNISQIAGSVNAGIARAENAKRGLFLLDQVYELMCQVAKNSPCRFCYYACSRNKIFGKFVLDLESTSTIIIGSSSYWEGAWQSSPSRE